MKCKTQLIPVLLTALFLLISLSIVGYSVAGNETAEGPEFILKEDTWSVEPAYIEKGESVTIEGEVKNIGDEVAQQYVDLYVNDMDEQEEYVTVTLEPGESKTVTFFFNKTDQTETYNILVEQPNSGDQWESQFEVKLETVENIDIDPKADQMTIKAGETINFSAVAYNNDDELMTNNDEEFIWYNADNEGLFDKTEKGTYDVKAELEGVESESITVIVEPAEASQLVFNKEPSEDKITAGEVAEYIVEVQDEYGNLQGEGEYNVTLEVNNEEKAIATIEDGENSTVIKWFTTREPGEYNIQALEENDLLSSTEKHHLTVTEKEDNQSALAGQWWVFPLSIVVIAVISLVYLSDMEKKDFSLDILGGFGKNTKANTHEWKRNKEQEESSTEPEEELTPSEEDIVRG